MSMSCGRPKGLPKVMASQLKVGWWRGEKSLLVFCCGLSCFVDIF